MREKRNIIQQKAVRKVTTNLGMKYLIHNLFMKKKSIQIFAAELKHQKFQHVSS